MLSHLLGGLGWAHVISGGHHFQNDAHVILFLMVRTSLFWCVGFCRDAQAAELVSVAALPCTREHRKINFHQKNTYDLEDFFSCFCRTEPNALFLQWNITFERTKFSQFWLQNGQTPLLAQEGPVGSNVVRIWLNLDQIWSQLGEIGTQWGPIYIYKLPINRPSGRYVKRRNIE